MKGYNLTSLSFDEIFPIGSVYLSLDTTNPATLFGGVWEQIKDKFLLCSGSSYNVNSTGGATTINLSHSHTSAAHTHGAANTQNGTLEAMIGSGQGDASSLAFKASNMNQTLVSTYYISGSWISPTTVNSHNTKIHGYTASTTPGNTGISLSSSQSIIPPYIAITVWKRVG